MLIFDTRIAFLQFFVLKVLSTVLQLRWRSHYDEFLSTHDVTCTSQLMTWLARFDTRTCFFFSRWRSSRPWLMYLCPGLRPKEIWLHDFRMNFWRTSVEFQINPQFLGVELAWLEIEGWCRIGTLSIRSQYNTFTQYVRTRKIPWSHEVKAWLADL